MSSNLNEIIWQLVHSIPKGKVATYGDIARLAGYPNHARFVGSVLKNLPAGSTLPWHRVVNAQGKLSFSPESDSYKRQQCLLENEGIVFNHQTLSLKQYRW